MSRYRVGCTGWGYDDWRGGFYPSDAQPKDHLVRYARVFSTTEVDSSYYAAPTLEQTSRWADVTPPDFRFSVKFPGAITHTARLRDVDDAVDAFLAVLTPLRVAGKLGPLLLQFPASFQRAQDGAALEAFLARFPKTEVLAVELRHASWWTRETYRALENADAALVWSSTEAGRTPPVVTSDRLYARLIGDRALTKFDRIQRDRTGEMRYWRDRFEDEGLSARDVMAFVNNHLMGFAPASALLLCDVLGLPRPDLAAARRAEGQASLGDMFGA